MASEDAGALSGPVILVAGPTASGKSALGLAVAERCGGTIINADSMQIYRELRILTARPTPDEESRVPHRLYGMLAADDVCSAGRWRELAVAAIREVHAEGRLPVVVGGTGLYLHALLHGLAPTPSIPDDVRQAARALHASLGGEAFHRRLAERDPRTAAGLRSSDPQRLIRAWEVLEATGRPLAVWQEQTAVTEGYRFLPLVLTPPRGELYARCDTRFLRMLEDGALDEVAELAAGNLDPSLPAMKALGVPDLRTFLAGGSSLETAVAAAQQATRRYAKRQLTWFRHQLPEARRLDAQFSERLLPEIFPIIDEFLLTDMSQPNRVAPPLSATN
jgi:tRNA dimethylallyltransferase